MERFVNLHSHTCGSHLDAIIRIKDLFRRVKEMGQTAIAITDHGNMSSMYEAYRESQKTGIKLIPGNEIYFVEDILDKKSKRRHLVLLATNKIGYKNLLSVTAEGFRHATNIMGRQFPRIDAEILNKYNEGLIATSACGGSIIAAHIFKGEKEKARQAAQIFKDIFGDRFYIELQPHELTRGDFNQNFLNDQLKEISAELGIEPVTTCDSHYLTKKHEKYHAMILAIGSKKLLEDPTRQRYDTTDPCVVCGGSGKFSPNDPESQDECYACDGIGGALRPCAEFYLKSEKEIVAFFSKKYGREYADRMIDNTQKIAAMCEPPHYMEPQGNRLPSFDPSDQEDFADFQIWCSTQKNGDDLARDVAYLRYQCWKSFHLVCKDFDLQTKRKYWNRIKSELEVYEGNGFSSYMLIVYDILNWARKQGFFVGLGRGCLTGDTQVLTANRGFVRLDKIKIGDMVFSHTGKTQKVTNTFKFDVSNESLLKISSNNSLGPITLTRDHKVYGASRGKASRGVEVKIVSEKPSTKTKDWGDDNNRPSFIEAKKLKVGDRLFMPKLERDILLPTSIDLSRYLSTEDRKGDKYIYVSTSILKVQKKSFSPNHVVDNLSNYNRVNRFWNFTPSNCYLLGRLIGYGWWRKTISGTYIVECSFNKKDKVGIEKTTKLFQKNGFIVYRIDSAEHRRTHLTIRSRALVLMLQELFPNYKLSPETKYIGKLKYLPSERLSALLTGLVGIDRHRNNSKEERYTTCSKSLMLDIKESLLNLNISAELETRTIQYKKAYTLKFQKIRPPSVGNETKIKSGYFSVISNIEKTTSDFVYDITVENDNSYVTGNYAVHNSVGGSLVAFMLKIHQADPLKYGLLFERFLNKFKKSLPDIDMDFAPSSMPDIMNYVKGRYGVRHVARISNIVRITPKVAIKDIARSLPVGGDKSAAFRIANDVTSDIPTILIDKDGNRKKIDTMDKALEVSKKLQIFVQQYPEVLEYANELVGLPRSFSVHAAGVIISDVPLDEYTPLRCDKDGEMITQYEKGACEENGLIKLDFLGIDTLDVLRETWEMSKKIGLDIPRPDDIPEDDKLAYKLIQSGNTVGCFQLEGHTMTPLCKPFRPNTIDDLAMINAIGRPSLKKEQRVDFINRRFGRAKPTPPHEKIRDILNHTYGVAVYEEDLQHIAREIAGWDYTKGDNLRKLTKSKENGVELAAKLKAEFTVDAMAHSNMSQAEATKFWEKVIVPFSKYGFNRSMTKTTDIKTTKGVKQVQYITPGDKVFTIDDTGKAVKSQVIALHDHGQVPMWKVRFNDGTTERCTLDHKWLTEYGQQPLWRILEEDLEIFGFDYENKSGLSYLQGAWSEIREVHLDKNQSSECSEKTQDENEVYIHSKANRLYQQESEVCDGSSWTSAFSTGEWRRCIEKGPNSRSIIRSGDEKKKADLNPIKYEQLKILWRTYENYLDRPFYSDKVQRTENLQSRKPIQIFYEGFKQAYDLEVSHPSHNFVLASGLCSSNSHATFYGTMGYRTAYYKAHASAPFFCALLNSETRGNKSDRAESIDSIKREARRFKIKIEVCDINLSKQYYEIKDKSTIITGLGAIKGLGKAALNYIIAGQPYTSFNDFLARVPSAVNKKMIQVLAKAGAFDSFGISRKFTFEHYDVVRKAVKPYLKKLDDSFFFGGDRTKPLSNYLNSFTHSMVSEENIEWTTKERLIAEKEVLDEYISGNVGDLFPGFFKGGVYEVSFAQINRLPEGTTISMEGVVQYVTELKIKKPGRNFGRTMARVTVETLRGDSVEVTMWPDDYKRYASSIGPDVAVRGMFKVNEFNGSKSLVLSVFEKLSPMQKEKV